MGPSKYKTQPGKLHELCSSGPTGTDTPCSGPKGQGSAPKALLGRGWPQSSGRSLFGKEMVWLVESGVMMHHFETNKAVIMISEFILPLS